jgi:hypothetical protein
MRRAYAPPVAKSTPFDNATNGFTATETQSAIEEAKSTAEGKARWMATAGFDGNASTGRYLEFNSNVDSNQSGLIIPVPTILKELTISVNTAATVTFSIYSWNGTTETLLTSISTSAARYNRVTGLNIALNYPNEIRVKCTSGSCSRPITFLFFQNS